MQKLYSRTILLANEINSKYCEVNQIFVTKLLKRFAIFRQITNNKNFGSLQFQENPKGT